MVNVQIFFGGMRKVCVGFFTSEKRCMSDEHGGADPGSNLLSLDGLKEAGLYT